MAISVSVFNSSKVVGWFLYTTSFKKLIKKESARLRSSEKFTDNLKKKKEKKVGVILSKILKKYIFA